MHRPNIRAVINCPMSDPAGAGHGACWGGPEGTLPPAGCSAARVVASVDPTFPLLERWPPGHPPQAPYCLMGIPICLGGGCWGAHSFHVVLFLGVIPPQAAAARSQQDHQILPEDGTVFPHLGEMLGRCVQLSFPFWGFECQTVAYAIIWSSQRSHSPNHDGFTLQPCYFYYVATRMLLIHPKYKKGWQILWLNSRAHPMDGCDPFSHKFPQCPPLK